MTKKREFFYAVVLLLSGAFLGASLCPFFTHCPLFGPIFGHPRNHRWGEQHRPKTEMIMRRLSNDLDLTEDQQEKLTPIVREMNDKLQQIRRENKPKLDAVLDQATEQSKIVLTPEQELKLREIHEHLKSHFAGGE